MSARCFVIDVGQGSATLVEGETGAALVDAGPGKVAVLRFLEDHSIDRLDAVFISHADKDHLGGLLALLAKASSEPSFQIGQVYLNPDSRDSQVWADVTFALDDLERRNLIKYSAQLGSDTFEDPLDLGGCSLRVLGPSKYMQLRAVGGKYEQRRKQSANSLSAVIHVAYNGLGWMLLPGDVDHLGFTDAVKRNAWLSAPVMVFPHHGGTAGSLVQTRSLAQEIVDASASKQIVFSGRSQSSKFPSAIVVDELLNLPAAPSLLCVGMSPILADRMAQLPSCSHRNGTGTLHVMPPDAGGQVEIFDYVLPISSASMH